MVVTGSELYDRLRLRFSFDKGWYLVEEIGVNSPWGRETQRRADLVAIGLWSSLGVLHRVGIEVKSTRRDWLSELNHPEKSAPLFNATNELYLAVTDKSIVRKEELPPEWGLMIPSGKSVRITKRAAKREAPDMPKDFIARLLTRHVESEGFRHKLSAEYHRGMRDGRDIEKKRIPRDEEQARKIERIDAIVEGVYQKTGINLSEYSNLDRIAKQIELGERLLSNRVGYVDILRRNLGSMESSVERLREIVADLENLAEGGSDAKS